jgi:molybdenum cofactor guanylyltransferase
MLPVLPTAATPVRFPGMIMVGAAEQNAGKTTFACRLIRRFTAQRPVVGVKVTTIVARDGECPRGKQGCGVCTSLKHDFEITQELDGPPGKDTTRMLEAGAERVYWLRTMAAHLPRAAAALARTLGPDALTVCESNSLRQAARPDLFIMARQKHSPRFKPSARRVRDRADREVLFDGSEHDLDTDSITVDDGRWVLREQATAIVLAGGQSRRMGQDKALLPLEGRPLLEHVVDRLRPLFPEILVSAGQTDREPLPGVRVIPDEAPGHGPLMGIASALAASSHALNFVVACDMPEIDERLVRRLLAAARGHDGAVPLDREGRFEPLFAVYDRRVLPTVRARLAEGRRRIVSLYEDHDIVELPLAGAGLVNLNTLEDYESFTCKGADG